MKIVEPNNALKTVITTVFVMMENVFVQKDSMEYYAKNRCVLTTALVKEAVLMVNVNVRICILVKVVK